MYYRTRVGMNHDTGRRRRRVLSLVFFSNTAVVCLYTTAVDLLDLHCVHTAVFESGGITVPCNY
jgi:hypothetical protein